LVVQFLLSMNYALRTVRENPLFCSYIHRRIIYTVILYRLS